MQAGQEHNWYRTGKAARRTSKIAHVRHKANQNKHFHTEEDTIYIDH